MTAETDMVERVARAICIARGQDPDAIHSMDCLPPIVTAGWEPYVRHARAAIAAMRTPTKPMLRAAAAAMSPGKRPTPKRVSEAAKHGIRYRAMIDSALSEKGKG